MEWLAVVGGEHGPELSATFVLAPPEELPAARLPLRGTARLPFDSEWRRLSGYEDPVDYATEVANRVMVAAFEHATGHTRSSQSSPERRETYAPPDLRGQWRLLLGALATEGRVVEVAPGRIEVTVVGDGGEQVVVTPGQ